MKTLVIYKSKTGFTKRYAEWIGEELSCEVVNINDLGKVSFKDVDLIIYGASIHAGKINGIKKIKKLAEEKKCRLVVFATGASPAEMHDEIAKKCRLVVFATGASPAEMHDEIAKIWKGNDIDDKTPHFYMQSGLCYEKMDLFGKLMIKLYAKMMKNKKDKTQSEADMTDAIQKSYDISSREFIKPLVEHVRKNS